MLRKNIVKALDPTTSWKVIGIDMAKPHVALAALPADGSDPQFVRVLSYEEFFEFAKQTAPTIMVFEPGNGANHFALRLQALGHTPKIVSGEAVKHWVRLHLSGQKNDTNDAYALAKLSFDPDLRTVRIKTVEQNRLQSVQAMRKQLVEQRSKTVVSLKGIFQNWGIIFKAESRNLKKFKKAAEDNRHMLGDELVELIFVQIDRISKLDEDIANADQMMDRLLEQDPQAKTISKIPFVGRQTTARLCSIMGDINDFPSPRSFVAFIGLVPKNSITGNKTTTASGYEQVGQGKVNRRGDKLARSLVIQCAKSMYACFHKEGFPECALKTWIQKQKDVHKPFGKIMVSLAAKILRIIYAILKYGQKFSYEKAGVSRSALAALKAASPAEAIAA